MNLLLGLLLAAAPSLSEASLEYRGPSSAKAPASQYAFSKYAVGEKLRCAVDGANLRQGPSVDGEPLAQVSFGDEVEILEVAGEAERVQDRVDRWYRVKTSAGTGYLFGNTLTPLYFQADLDNDGKAEQITVAFTAKLSVIVRVFEPWKDKDAGRIHGAVLRLSGGKVRGGEVRAAVHTRDDGWGVVEVQSCVKKACATGIAAFIDDKALGSSRVSTKKGKSAVDFSVGGVTVGGWKNLFTPGKRSLVKAECPGECRADAALVRGPRYKAATYEIESYPRAPSASGPCEVIGLIKGSRYDGAELVSCPISDGGKSEPSYIDDHYYALQGKVWTHISGEMSEDQREGLKRSGVKPRGATRISIPGLDPPAVLRAGKFGSLNLVRHDEGEVSGAPVFVDPRVGPVYAVEGGYAAAHPHKGRWLYDWVRPDEEIEGKTYTHAWRGASGYDDLRTRFVAVPKAGLEARAGKLVPTAASSPLYGPLLEGMKSAGGMGWQPSVSVDEGAVGLFANAAVFVEEDDFGRQVALTRADLIPPLLAEPIVYLWPERETDFRLRVGGVGFATSWPEADGTSWAGRARPDGGIVVDGRGHDRLFWEGFGEDLPLLDGGIVVTRATAREALAALARRAGLAGREVDELVDAWAPRAARRGRALIRVVDPAALAARVPLEVEPRPDLVLRLYLVISTASDDEVSAPIALPAGPSRRGFVVVEWGGIER